MKTVDVYEVGEEVLIKAKVSAVYFEKDRISYELKDCVTGKKYEYKFSDKDMRICPDEE